MARSPQGAPREVFLSHAGKDHAFVHRMAQMLRDHGVPIWFSGGNIIGAQQWHDEIGRALERCDWFVVVLSPASVKSRWVKQELLFALNERRYQNRIVPVLKKDCNQSRLVVDAAQLSNGGFHGRVRGRMRKL